MRAECSGQLSADVHGVANKTVERCTAVAYGGVFAALFFDFGQQPQDEILSHGLQRVGFALTLFQVFGEGLVIKIFLDTFQLRQDFMALFPGFSLRIFVIWPGLAISAQHVIPAHDKGDAAVMEPFSAVFFDRFHMCVRETIRLFERVFPGFFAVIESIIVLRIGALNNAGQPVAHGAEGGHLLRLFLRLVHFPDPPGDADLKIRALDKNTAVLLGEPLKVECIGAFGGSIGVWFAGGGEVADLSLLFRLQARGDCAGRGLGVGEAEFAAGDIAPGIASQINDNGILPADQPEPATHIVAGGVVDFATDDGSVETQGHARMRAWAGRECQAQGMA